MTRTPVMFLLVALLAVSAGAQSMPDPIKAFGQKSKSFSFDLAPREKGGQVTWTARQQEYVRDEYVALEGTVKIHYQDISMSADKLTYNFKTKDVTAEGNVIIDQGPQRLWGERAFFNLESKTGTLFRASGAFQSSFFFSGEKIEKLDERTYRLTDGLFTSCELDDPAWSFHVRNAVVTMDDYARLSHVSFRARKVPILWTPYLVWPTKRDRARGFLIPHVGYSSRFGGYLSSSYFIPFGKWADTTLTADLYTRGYYGFGNETRYVPSKDVDGRLRADAVRDHETGKLEWKYTYQHTQDNLPGGFRGVIDMRDFSDLSFFRRFSRDYNLNTLSDIYSAAYLTKNRAQYSINLRTDRRERFSGFETNPTVFEQLPSLEFREYPTRVASSPVYFSLESSAAHLRTSRGANYYRGDIFPTLSLQMKTPTWLAIKPQLSLRDTYYTSSQDSLTQTLADDSISRRYGQAQVEVVGPSFSRIFSGEVGGFSRFKHVIEPRVRYVYTTSTDDQHRIIQFDTVDSPFLPLVRDTVEYSLTQRVLAKPKTEGSSAREIMSLTFRQTASLSEPLDRSASFVGRNRYTPLSITAHVNPYQAFAVDANASFGSVSRQLDQASVSGNLRSKNSSFVAFTYFATYRPPGAASGGSSQLRLTADAPIWRDKLRGSIQLNYDGQRHELLEQRILLGGNASCYSIALEYRDFQVFRTDPLTGGAFQRNRDFQLSVSLKNVGTFVDLRGSLDRNK